MARETVREVRVRLATVLRDARPGDDEALLQLRHALQEPAARPADWEIHRSIGEVLLERGDAAAALAAFTRAGISAPLHAGPAAEAALDLLRSPDDLRLVSEIPPEDSDALVAAVRAGSAAPPVSRLAAALSRARGDLDGAVAILKRAAAGWRPPEEVVADLGEALIEQGRPQDALGYLDGRRRRPETTVLRARALVDLERFQEALAAVKGAPADDPAVPCIRALALSGLGKVDAALQALKGAPPSRDVFLIEAMARLQRAARGNGTIDAGEIAAADQAATAAARIDTGSVDVMVVRAQVNLEGGLDVEEGRRLLAAAVKRARALQRCLLLPPQPRAPKDQGWFQYFLVEVAAALGGDAEVLAAAESVDRRTTAYAHDGALAMLLAPVYERREGPAAAASEYTSAASAYDTAGLLREAVGAARSAVAAERTPERAIDLAEYLWRWSTHAGCPPGEVVGVLAEGLEEVRLVETDVPAGLAGRTAVIRGLLLTRSYDIAVDDRVRRAWRPVPWLLLAALQNPEESYWSAHVAWALMEVSAYRAALQFAERAYALNEADSYTQEVVLAARVNYHGRLDPDGEKIAGDFGGDASWRDSIVAAARFFDGRMGGSPEAIKGEVFDARWARDVRARVTALLAGIEAAEPQLRALRDEALKPPTSYNLAAEASLLLDEPERARELLRTGRERGDLTDRTVEVGLATVDLVTSGGQDGERVLAAFMASGARPQELRTYINIDLPLLGRVGAPSPALEAAVARLQAAARGELARRERSPLPPLTVDADWDPDGVERDVVRSLLELAERTSEGRWLVAAEAAEALAVDQDQPLMRTGLRELASLYRDTARRSPEAAEAPEPVDLPLPPEAGERDEPPAC